MSRPGNLRLALALACAALVGRHAEAMAQTPGVAASTPADADGAGQAERPGRANPLWAIPLESLRATRERPLFSASRRPPPPPVVAAAQAAPPPPPAPPSEPEKPQLQLVGVVHGAKQDIGIFINQMDQSVIRLRVGQENNGWAMRSVDLRATMLQKDTLQVKLELPARDATGAAGPQVAVNSSGPPPAPMFRTVNGPPRPDQH